jgi:hypothetical protein
MTTQYAVNQITPPDGDTGYQFLTTEVFAASGEPDVARAHMQLRAWKLLSAELNPNAGSEVVLNTDDRIVLKVEGPAAGYAENCPVRITLTVVEID